MGGGKNVQVGGEICIIMADSCWYVAETTQHDIAIIFQWKINELKKKKNPFGLNPQEDIHIKKTYSLLAKI